jgi:hypothetical protein
MQIGSGRGRARPRRVLCFGRGTVSLSCRPAAAAAMDDEQRYLFDSRGVFTIPGALSLSHVDELNQVFTEVEESAAPEYGGAAGRMGGDALHWGRAYRDLLDMPRISPVLEELVGNHRESPSDIPSFRIDHINVHNRCKGATHPQFDGFFQGHNLHGGGLGSSGNIGGGGSQFYRYQDGMFFNGLTVITYELKDTHCNGGGFCCVPGTHTGHMKLPQEWGDMSNPNNLDAEWLYKVPASAGDAVVFTEALTQ